MTAANFPAALAFTLSQEGGWADVPGDPGGPTNQGITLAAYRLAFGHGTVEDLRSISPQDVSTIYRKFYWQEVRGDALPAGLDLMLFDMAVNAGVGASARLLQRILGTREDGIIGPLTLAALSSRLEQSYGHSPLALINSLHVRQVTYYQGLAGFPTFGRGWLTRAAARVTAALGLLGEAA